MRPGRQGRAREVQDGSVILLITRDAAARRSTWGWHSRLPSTGRTAVACTYSKSRSLLRYLDERRRAV